MKSQFLAYTFILLILDLQQTCEFDVACRSKGGDCQEARYRCYGHYQTGLCGKDGSRQCCVHVGDSRCTKLGGKCQDDHANCSFGRYLDDVCPGPPNRKCCVGRITEFLRGIK